MSKFLGLLVDPIVFSLDLGCSCRGDCQQGRAGCPSPLQCSGQLSDHELAAEVERFERNTPARPIDGAANIVVLRPGSLLGRLKAWLASASARPQIEAGRGSIADVIALEHAAAEEAHITGLELEHCQKYVRRNAGLVAGLKKGGAA